MIITLKPACSPTDIEHMLGLLARKGLTGWPVPGAAPPAIEILGAEEPADARGIEDDPRVDRVKQDAEPLLAAARKPGDATRPVPLGNGAIVGGRKLAIIAGPCSVEDEAQVLEIAAAVKEAGATALRGGVFKPRTSPYTFQGCGQEGLEWLALARERTGLAIVTEVLAGEHVELVARYADVLQVGSRSMHQTQLLKAVGRQDKPVLLKRGFSASLHEFLQAAEYILLGGNRNVILCERGIRTHETYVRNTLALAVVPEIHRRSHLPIIVDPSHGTGQAHLVAPMSKAAVACGADGLLIEVQRPGRPAWTDAAQSLDFEQFRTLMKELDPFARAGGRCL